MDNTQIEAIRHQYPKIVSKDQVYRICHISKKTALYLLESGLIPCEKTDKKTRRFRVKLNDVIAYLIDREKNPQAYKPPENYYKKPKCEEKRYIRISLTPEQKPEARIFFEHKLEKYNDVMTTADVSRFLGYSLTTITDWYEKKEIRCFLIKNKLAFPKEYLLDFILSERCNGIKKKSIKHIALLKVFLSAYKQTIGISPPFPV